MRCRSSFVLLAVGATGLAACTEEKGRPAPSEGSAASERAPAEETLQTLLDLGYVGETEIRGADGVLLLDRERMSPGYTLFCAQSLATARLIDEEGRVVKSWSDPEAEVWHNVELLENGDLLTTGNDPSGAHQVDDDKRFALRMSWDGEILWKTYLPCHHDLTWTPDGELVTLTIQRRKIPELHPRTAVADNGVTRLSADGEPKSSVSIYRMLKGRPDLHRIRNETARGAFMSDLFHCNSLEWMARPGLFDRHALYGPDNLLVSSRHQDALFVFDMRAKEVVWAWGEEVLEGPHDASVLPGGNILVFDNGRYRGWSRILELDPVAREIVWKYEHPEDVERPGGVEEKRFFSETRGSCQRLSNGNTLICNSDKGEIFEVTQEGDWVWHFVSPERVPERASEGENGSGRESRANFVRAYRFERAFIDGLLGN